MSSICNLRALQIAQIGAEYIFYSMTITIVIGMVITKNDTIYIYVYIYVCIYIYVYICGVVIPQLAEFSAHAQALFFHAGADFPGLT